LRTDLLSDFSVLLESAHRYAADSLRGFGAIRAAGEGIS
jgi:hypothetical protein